MPLLDPRIRLRHVLAFVETSRLGGVARAAGALGLSQPAVSKSLGELEDILGASLFDRSRRSLSLTPAGELFLRHAEAGIATLRQGVDALGELRTGVGVVAFGALPTVAAGIVPRALLAFSRTPLARRTLVESGPSQYLLELLRTAAIDFVVGRLAHPSAMAGLSFEQLYSDTLVCVTRTGHPLAARRGVDLREIETLQVLMPPRRAIIRPAVDALLIARGVGGLRNEIETVSNSLGRAYVLMSDAVWIISRGVVERDLAAGTLAALDVDMTQTQGAVGITTRAGAELGPASRQLLDCIRAAGGG